MKPILVACLGNEIMADDAFGYHVARAVQKECRADELVDIEFAPIAGFHLLDMIIDRKAVLIVDNIMTGNFEPGYLHFFRMGYDTPTKTLVSSHQISLPTALRFGKAMGFEMPEQVDVLAVEAQDVYTLSETMSPAAEKAVIKAALRVDDWIREKKRSLNLYGERIEKNAGFRR